MNPVIAITIVVTCFPAVNAMPGSKERVLGHNGGFKIGTIQIPSFSISRSSSSYEPGKRALGVIIYDIGSCPKSVCPGMDNGHAFIYHADVLKSEEGADYVNIFDRAIRHHFRHSNMSFEDLCIKYSMRFAGFSVKGDQEPIIGYGSSILNSKSGPGLWNLKDGNRNLNAYEASMAYMITTYWVQGRDEPISFSDAQEFWRENLSDMKRSYENYANRMREKYHN